MATVLEQRRQAGNVCHVVFFATKFLQKLAANCQQGKVRGKKHD
jgi:hypothetical protein